VLDDVVDVLREPADVLAEVFFEQRVVFLVDLAERPIGPVRERALLRIQLQVLDQFGELRLGDLGPVGEYLRSLPLAPVDQHAFQAADDDDRQDHALVFVGLELAPQPLGRFPNIAGQVVQLGFVQGKGHQTRFLA
jgi:hypothetical protein